MPDVVRFLVPGDDQLNRSCGWTSLPPLFMKDPRPSTSSISCSVERWASYVVGPTGRVNWNGCAEFSVTIPSYGPPVPTWPSANIAAGVLRPRALPSALETTTFVDRGMAGRLAFAVASLAVFASATKEETKVVQAVG